MTTVLSSISIDIYQYWITLFALEYNKWCVYWSLYNFDVVKIQFRDSWWASEIWKFVHGSIYGLVLVISSACEWYCVPRKILPVKLIKIEIEIIVDIQDKYYYQLYIQTLPSILNRMKATKTCDLIRFNRQFTPEFMQILIRFIYYLHYMCVFVIGN